MDKITFTKFIIDPKIFWSNFILLGVFILIGFGCSHYMELEGHYVTGMNNQIVWGLTSYICCAFNCYCFRCFKYCIYIISF